MLAMVSLCDKRLSSGLGATLASSTSCSVVTLQERLKL